MEEVLQSSRLDQLKELARVLAVAIDSKPGARDLSQLAKQYRDTIKEIEDIEGGSYDRDEIGDLLDGREADGKSNTIR